MSVLFGILGILLGVALGLLVSVSIIKKSNDFGDSYGTMKDFDGKFKIIASSDHVKKSYYDNYGGGKNTSDYIDKLSKPL